MTVNEIANKYGRQVQNDASGSAIENLKTLIVRSKKAVKTKSGDINAKRHLMIELVKARSAANSEYNALSKEAYNLTSELDNLTSSFKNRR